MQYPIIIAQAIATHSSFTNSAAVGVSGDTGGGVGLFLQSSLSSISEMNVLFLTDTSQYVMYKYDHVLIS